MRFSDIKAFSKIEHLTLTEYQGISGGAIVLELNNRKAPFDNQKVRQAIAHAVDRSHISNVLHGGYTKPARSPLPATNVFFDDAMEGYPLDLDKANALLDEAGFPRKDDDMRFEVGLIYIAQPFMPDFQSLPSEYIATALKKVGIKVRLEPLQGFAGWAERSAAWDFDMSINWPGDKTDPAIGVSRLYVCDNIKNQAYTNTSGYCNSRSTRSLQRRRSKPISTSDGACTPGPRHLDGRNADGVVVRHAEHVLPPQGPVLPRVRHCRELGRDVLDQGAKLTPYARSASRGPSPDGAPRSTVMRAEAHVRRTTGRS